MESFTNSSDMDPRIKATNIDRILIM